MKKIYTILIVLIFTFSQAGCTQNDAQKLILKFLPFFPYLLNIKTSIPPENSSMLVFFLHVAVIYKVVGAFFKTQNILTIKI